MLLQLALRGFRNLERQTWTPEEGTHLLLGGTGSGKTSLLEAVYLVTTTRSFRVAQPEACLSRSSDGAKQAESFRLEAEVSAGARVRLEVGYVLGEGSWRRLNGRRTPLREHLQAQPVVAWTAGDHDVLLGVQERRRRFVDRGLLALDPSFIELMTRYRRILDHKRHLLGRALEGLESWNEMLIPVAAEIQRRRQTYIRELGQALAAALAATGVAFPRIELTYRPSPAGEPGVERLARALAEVASEERSRRRPLVGPHLDRLQIHWAGREVRSVASAGERKALGLLLAAAQAALLRRADRSPLLLLDDADTELDPTTLAALWPELRVGSQLLVSSNRSAVWEGLEVDRFWTLRQGLLSAT